MSQASMPQALKEVQQNLDILISHNSRHQSYKKSSHGSKLSKSFDWHVSWWLVCMQYTSHYTKSTYARLFKTVTNRRVFYEAQVIFVSRVKAKIYRKSSKLL